MRTNTPSLFRRAVSSLLVFVFTLLQVVPPGFLMRSAQAQTTTPVLKITKCGLVKIVKVKTLVYDFVVKADVTNLTTQTLTNVTATLSANPNLTLVDNSLTFGAVGAKATVASQDTFTIRMDQWRDLLNMNLNWAFQYKTTALAPSVSLSASPASVVKGNSATLTWTSTNATSVTIDNGVGSVALNGSVAVTPTATTTYTITAVGAGGTASKTAMVTVTVPPPAPTVTLSISPASMLQGNSATLTWTSANATSVTIDNGVGSVALNGSVAVTPSASTTYTITAVGAGGTASKTAMVTVTAPPPTVTLTADPMVIGQGYPSVLSWSSANAASCTIDNGIGNVALNGTLSVSPATTTTYTITATGNGGTQSQSVTITVGNLKPTISFSSSASTIAKGSSVTLNWSVQNGTAYFIDNGIGAVSASGSVSVTPTATTLYKLAATGPYGSADAGVLVTVTSIPQPLPAGTYGAQYQSVIPADAAITQYDPNRFAVIRGQVVDKNNAPLAQVLVSLDGHPQYGTARTDTKGQFSIAAEAALFNVRFSKDGYITSQRQIKAMANDIAVVETVTMLSQDTKSTEVVFSANPSIVTVHQSAPVTDQSGTRRASIVFTGDNKAYAVDQNGNDMFELQRINVRATEFPTPQSMPAVLPPTSGFTYCAEYKVEGVDRVRFKDPVITWVDNFLGFNVGETVPSGYYDRDKGVWVPSTNGKVVRLLDTNSDGKADALDANGDSQPDDLNANGDFADEVKGLDDASQYQPGKTFWRIPLGHFTSWDFNFPVAHPNGVVYPNASGAALADAQKDDCSTQGSDKKEVNSYVSCRSRIYHEDIALPGTGLTLHYSSNRVSDYKKIITVPVSGSSVPSILKKIRVKLVVAGKTYTKEMDPLPNQSADFEWDGLDYLGNSIPSVSADIIREFVYEGLYSGFGGDVTMPVFGSTGLYITTVAARSEFIMAQTESIRLYNPTQVRSVLGDGWTVSNQHYLSFMTPDTLFKGDGSLVINGSGGIISTVAGVGGEPNIAVPGNNVPATIATLNNPSDVAVDGAGNLYIADTDDDMIRKVSVNGIITTVTGTPYYNWDTIYTYHLLNMPYGVAVDRFGSVFIADSFKNRICKPVNTTTVALVAGLFFTADMGGSNIEPFAAGYTGDGGAATSARLNSPRGVEVDLSGNIYIADTLNHVIRKIDTTGVITTIAGTGAAGFSGDGGQATAAKLYYPQTIAVDSDGNLYIADTFNSRIRKVNTSGIITTFAGTGAAGYSGDEGAATSATLNWPQGVAVDSFSNVYISDTKNHCIRKVDSSGIIRTIAGGRGAGFSGDGGSAIVAKMNNPLGIALDDNGNIYFADYANQRIRKISSGASFAPATSSQLRFAEEGIGYVFTADGSHQKTIELDTGKVLEQFGYDASGRLISSTDRFGNKVTIERSSSGAPTAIVSPDGLRTTLTVDSNNHLTRITYPDGKYYAFDYSTGGLLTKETEPNGNYFTHVFDANGRITDVTDQEGQHEQFARTYQAATGDVLSTNTSGEGNVVSYLDHNNGGALESTATVSGVANTLKSVAYADGITSKVTRPDLSVEDYVNAVDPENKYSYLQSAGYTMPSGLKAQAVFSRLYEDTNSDAVKDRITKTLTFNGKTTTVVHHVLAGQVTATSALGKTLTLTYDPATLLTSKVAVPGLLDTTYTYDARGRLIDSRQGSRAVTLTYNGAGEVASVKDPLGRSTSYEYDAVGRPTVMHRPDSTDVRFTYDANGNMTRLTVPSSAAHDFTYTKANLPASYKAPLSAATTAVYDKDRRLKNVTLPSGKVISNVYTATLLTQVQTPEGNIDLGYLASGQLGSITKGSEAVSYTYDGSLLMSETSAGTLAQGISYTYNNDFNLTSQTYAGITSAFGYDNDGLLTSAGGFTITRNAQNGLPTAVAGGALSLSRTFNEYGEVSTQNMTVNGSSALNMGVTYNANGQIITKSENIAGVTVNYAYEYDAQGRLLKVTKDGTLVEEYRYNNVASPGLRTYEMNSARGITGRSLTYNAEDQLTAAGTTAYQYDADGRLSKKTAGTSVTSYTYSSRGELLTAVLPSGANISYMYDALGRRIAKKVNGTTTEKYLWSGLTRLLAVYDGANNLTARFEYADGRMPVAMNKGGATYYLAYDQVGSLRGVYNASGALVKQVTYDTFGNVLTDTAPAITVPFGFAGGLHDRDTGLVHFGYRDYDPETGRWTAKDPIGFNGGDVDLMGYVQYDPVNWIDPEGLLGEFSMSAPVGSPQGPIVFPPAEPIPGPTGYPVPDPVPSPSGYPVPDPIPSPTGYPFPGPSSGPAVFPPGEPIRGGACPLFSKEHTKNKRPSNWDKHSKARPGRPTTKNRQKPDWRENPNKKK